MSSIYLTFKSILSNAMYCLKKLSEVLGLNWSKSSVYCVSLKGDRKLKMYFELIVSLKINSFGIYYICLNQKYVKDKDADEPVVRWSRRAQVVWGRQWGSDLPTTSPAPSLLPGSGAMAQTSLAYAWERTQWARDRKSKTLYSTSGTKLVSREIQLSRLLNTLLANAIA